MTGGILSGGGLSHGTPPLATCELEGGSEAMATQLLEVSVVPGSELLLIVETNAPATSLVVIWGEPAFIGSGAVGEVSLLDLDWEPWAAGSGAVLAFRAPGDRDLLLGGRPCDAALLMTAAAGLRVRVPLGCERLVVECGFDGDPLPGPNARARCAVYRATPV